MPVVDRTHVINIDSTAITASGNKTDTFSVGTNEEYIINEIRVVQATGAYDFALTDDTGRAYQNEAARYPAVPANPNEFNIYKQVPPLQMPPNSVWSFKFTDVSAAANRVRLLLIGVRRLNE